MTSTWVLILIMGVMRGGSAVTHEFNSEEACKAVIVELTKQKEAKQSFSTNGPGEIYGGCFRK